MSCRASREAAAEAAARAAAALDDETEEGDEEEDGETGFPWQELDEEEEDAADSAAEGWQETSADDLLARELGFTSVEELSPVQQQYKDKLLRKIEVRAPLIRKLDRGAGRRSCFFFFFTPPRPPPPGSGRQERRAAEAAANLEGETQLQRAVELYNLGRYREAVEQLEVRAGCPRLRSGINWGRRESRTP